MSKHEFELPGVGGVRSYVSHKKTWTLLLDKPSQSAQQFHERGEHPNV